MTNHIVDCKTHAKIDVPLTPGEEAEQQDQVTQGAQQAAREEQRKQARAAALERVKNSPVFADLLTVLGLDEPATQAVRTKKAP